MISKLKIMGFDTQKSCLRTKAMDKSNITDNLTEGLYKDYLYVDFTENDADILSCDFLNDDTESHKPEEEQSDEFR